MQYPRRARLLDSTGSQQHDVVCHRQRFLLIVGDKDHRGSKPSLQLLDLYLQLLPQLAIERAEGFVQEQNRGPIHERAGERDALLLASGQLCGQPSTEVPQLHQVQRTPDLDIPVRARDATLPERIRDVFRNRHVREQCVTLEDHPDAPPMRRQPSDVPIVETDAALVGSFEPGHGHQDGRLSRPARAEEREDAPCRRRQCHPVQCDHVTVELAQAADMQCGRCAHRRTPTPSRPNEGLPARRWASREPRLAPTPSDVRREGLRVTTGPGKPGHLKPQSQEFMFFRPFRKTLTDSNASVQAVYCSKDNAVQSFREIADELTSDITEGRIKAGDRLATQRNFAAERRIALSTASRVYGELSRRGLTTGEVGRGTFVRSLLPVTVMSQFGNATVDLEYNFPNLPSQAALLTTALEDLINPMTLSRALLPVNAASTAKTRDIASVFLTRKNWKPDPGCILFAGNGRQAIAAALSASVRVGERIGVEWMTYPAVKGMIRQLGLVPVPIAMDCEGLRPDALAEVHRATSLRAIYVQPNLQNPLGATLSEERREEIGTIARRLNLTIVEDAVYSFLLDQQLLPIAAFAPERTIFIESLSKRASPGLTLGFLVAPQGPVLECIASNITLGAWTPAGFALEAGSRWLTDGSISSLEAGKRKDAIDRQGIATECLSGISLIRDPRSYHLWLELPDGWRAETFVSAAARRGIAVTPAATFAVTPGHAPNAVRLALASPPLAVLSQALGTLAYLLRGMPDMENIE